MVRVYLILLVVLFNLNNVRAQQASDKQPCSNYPEIIDDFTPQKEQNYIISTNVIEVKKLKGYTLSQVFTLFISHNYFVAPTLDTLPVYDCNKVITAVTDLINVDAIQDPIVTKVDQLNQTVTNYTLPGHRQHTGKVVRKLLIKDGWIVLQTAAKGNDGGLISQEFNDFRLSMNQLWKAVDNKFVKYMKDTFTYTPTHSVVKKNKRTFSWNDGHCDFTGVYLTGNFTVQQLRNTSSLIGISENTSLPNFFFREPLDIAKYDSSTYKTKATEIINKLDTLNIIPGPYWQAIRRRILIELKMQAEYTTLKIQAFTNPSVLRDKTISPACSEYVDAIVSGGPVMMEAWRKLRVQQSMNNADPDFIMNSTKINLRSQTLKNTR